MGLLQQPWRRKHSKPHRKQKSQEIHMTQHSKLLANRRKKKAAEKKRMSAAKKAQREARKVPATA